MAQIATLLFLLQGQEICLAMKKKGFGQGRWNGVGGKQEKGESIAETAIRETYEEIGVRLGDLKRVAVLDFKFEGAPAWDQQVHVYLARSWEGSPTESDEARPAWFAIDRIPFDQMWEDERVWLPSVLAGQFVKGRFLFDSRQRMVSHSVETSPIDTGLSRLG
jgi:ADP-ribose pyrophosphatase YjhB (NUDIX family)